MTRLTPIQRLLRYDDHVGPVQTHPNPGSAINRTMLLTHPTQSTQPMQRQRLSRVPLRAVMLGLACVALCLTGCIRPYKIDIQQGNVITTAQMQQVKPGMSRREVRYVLGSPPVADTFHQNRWDYVYTHKPSKRAQVERRQFAVMFEDDVVSSIEGDLSQLEGVKERYVLDGHLVDPNRTNRKGRVSRLFNADERAARKEAKQLEKEAKKREKEAKKLARMQKREAKRKAKAAAAEQKKKVTE